MALLYMEDAYRYIINSELLLTKKKNYYEMNFIISVYIIMFELKKKKK